jgi:hypothetical protein
MALRCPIPQAATPITLRVIAAAGQASPSTLHEPSRAIPAITAPNIRLPTTYATTGNPPLICHAREKPPGSTAAVGARGGATRGPGTARA